MRGIRCVRGIEGKKPGWDQIVKGLDFPEEEFRIYISS